MRCAFSSEGQLVYFCIISYFVAESQLGPIVVYCDVIFFTIQPVNLEQYDMIRSMSSEIRAYAPDARVLTTYYSGEYYSL